jgi:hypothetical protein
MRLELGDGDTVDCEAALLCNTVFCCHALSATYCFYFYAYMVLLHSEAIASKVIYMPSPKHTLLTIAITIWVVTLPNSGHASNLIPCDPESYPTNNNNGGCPSNMLCSYVSSEIQGVSDTCGIQTLCPGLSGTDSTPGGDCISAPYVDASGNFTGTSTILPIIWTPPETGTGGSGDGSGLDPDPAPEVSVMMLPVALGVAGLLAFRARRRAANKT